MEATPAIIIIFLLLVVLFLVIYFIKNRKDHEELEDQVKKDYHKKHGETTRGEKGTPDYPEI